MAPRAGVEKNVIFELRNGHDNLSVLWELGFYAGLLEPPCGLADVSSVLGASAKSGPFTVPPYLEGIGPPSGGDSERP